MAWQYGGGGRSGNTLGGYLGRGLTILGDVCSIASAAIEELFARSFDFGDWGMQGSLGL